VDWGLVVKLALPRKVTRRSYNVFGFEFMTEESKYFVRNRKPKNISLVTLTRHFAVSKPIFFPKPSVSELKWSLLFTATVRIFSCHPRPRNPQIPSIYFSIPVHSLRAVIFPGCMLGFAPRLFHGNFIHNSTTGSTNLQ
jgi:hypothetical protein